VFFEGVWRNTAGLAIGLLGGVRFANVPAHLKIEIAKNTAKVENKFINPEPLTVDLVQVKVATPAEEKAATRTTAGNFRAFGKNVAFVNSTPTDGGIMGNGRGGLAYFPYTISGKKDNFPVKVTLAQDPADRGPALQWRADITLNGPTVDGVVNSGVNFIHVGFIQHATASTFRGYYSTAPKTTVLVSQMENADEANLWGGKNIAKYFVDTQDYEVYFDAQAGKGKQSNTLFSGDGPRASLPLVNDRDRPAPLIRIEIKWNWDLTVSAQTVAPNAPGPGGKWPAFWAEAKAPWSWVTAVNLGPPTANPATGFVWKKADRSFEAKIVPPSTQDWSRLTTSKPDPQSVKGPVFNDELEKRVFSSKTV
jgi:hypothetical protein